MSDDRPINKNTFNDDIFINKTQPVVLSQFQIEENLTYLTRSLCYIIFQKMTSMVMIYLSVVLMTMLTAITKLLI
jgi:hypothetical protein